MLAFTGDNATSNDTQVSELAALPNSFKEQCRVRCFNHTMQLSAKALIKPFDSKQSKSPTNDADEEGDTDDVNVEDDDEDEDEDEDIPDLETPDGDDNPDDDIETEAALAEMSEEEREILLSDTLEVRSSLTKVSL